MLNGTLELRDVTDVEAHVDQIIRRHLRRTGSRLGRDDRDDLAAYLIATTWELSGRFTPTTTAASFGAYSASICSMRIVDWLRQRRGRTVWRFAGHVHERERPQLLSLDAPAGRGRNDPGGDHTLGSALAGRAGDPADGCDPALAGIIRAGHRQRARDQAIVRALAA